MSSHPAGHQPDRTVDAIANRYVEEAAALDPVLATYSGVAGHDHELTGPLPRRLRRPRGPEPQGARRRPRRPARRRARAGRPRGVHRAAQPRGRDGRRRDPAQRGLGHLQRRCTTIRGAFDLMPTEGEEAHANIDARLAAVPAALAGYRQTLLESADKGRRRRRRGSTARSPGRSAAGPARRAPAATSSRTSSPPWAPRARCRLRLDRHAAEAQRGVRGVRPLPQRRARSAGPRPRGRRPRRRTPCAVALLPRARRSTSTRPTPGAGHELKRLDDEMVATADAIVARRHRRRGRRRPRRRPDSLHHGEEAFRDWMQELADRDGRRDGRRALRHPRADPHGSSADSLRPTTAASTTPARARTSAGPGGCGGRCPTASTPSPPGAR